MKILVLSPHADDGEIGCGGTIIKKLAAGHEVKWIVFSNYRVADKSYDIVAKEFKASMKTLGVEDCKLLNFFDSQFESSMTRVRQIIYDAVHTYKPDVVYAPIETSGHEDHRAVAIATKDVINRIDAVVLGYPVLGDIINPNEFEILTEEHVNQKLDAIMCYKSQVKTRPWFNRKNMLTTVTAWASRTSHAYVEAFELMKRVNE